MKHTSNPCFKPGYLKTDRLANYRVNVEFARRAFFLIWEDFTMTNPMTCRFLLVLLLLGLAGCANVPAEDAEGAGTVERWECGDFVDGCWFGGCPVKLTTYFTPGIGSVEFAGTTNATRFQVKGLARRWDWCPLDDGRYGCAFVIDADGEGNYYDFSIVMPDADGASRTKPSQSFQCTRRRVTNE